MLCDCSFGSTKNLESVTARALETTLVGKTILHTLPIIGSISRTQILTLLTTEQYAAFRALVGVAMATCRIAAKNVKTHAH